MTETKNSTYEYYKSEFGIGEELLAFSEKVQDELNQTVFKKIDQVKEYNQIKVIKAMQKNRLSDTHFSGTTGYRYNDRGREVLDSVYADVFGAEDAIVRASITCGTHALALCLYGILRPGDELLSVSGKPYDTLEEVIGIRGQHGSGSLRDFGISFIQIELEEDGTFKYEYKKKTIKKNK